MMLGVAGMLFTVIVVLAEVAVAEVTHVAFDVRITLTASLLANVALVYVLPVPVTFVPFTLHW